MSGHILGFAASIKKIASPATDQSKKLIAPFPLCIVSSSLLRPKSLSDAALLRITTSIIV